MLSEVVRELWNSTHGGTLEPGDLYPRQSEQPLSLDGLAEKNHSLSRENKADPVVSSKYTSKRVFTHAGYTGEEQPGAQGQGERDAIA